MGSEIDHIVLVVPNLELGMASLFEKTGVMPIFGGRHLKQGTHNALLRIGESSYLELLAVDRENKDISAPRWMGVDLINSSCITRWAIKSDTIQSQLEVLNRYNKNLGFSKEGQRITPSGNQLVWELSVPLPKPKVEVIPFLIDWKESIHPSKGLGNQCKISRFTLGHPNPLIINEVLKELNFEMTIFKASEPTIVLELETPKGVILI